MTVLQPHNHNDFNTKEMYLPHNMKKVPCKIIKLQRYLIIQHHEIVILAHAIS